MKKIKTFESLYLFGCRLRKEKPFHIKIYKNLDKLWDFMKTHSDVSYDKFKAAFSWKRSCIAIPFELAKEKRYDPDHYGDVAIRMSCPATDQYISMVIDQMPKEDFKLTIDGKYNIITWKLERLEKVLNWGWKKFRFKYLNQCIQIFNKNYKN